MVMDAGALGKKIQSEILQRHSLNIIAAEKQRKFEFIELLNDDLRTGKLKSFDNSRFEQDCALVTWDKSAKTIAQGRLKVSENYHSDINDAVLYAWRECRHFGNEPAIPKTRIDPNSQAWADAYEAKLMEAAQFESEGNEVNVDDAELQALFRDD